MLILFPFLLFQTKPKVDQRIIQDWTAAVATGLKSATLSLRRDGRFSLVSIDSAGKRETIKGTYAIAPLSDSQVPKATARINFYYDLDSLRKSRMSKTDVEALRSKGKDRAVGMQLTFFPDVPVLTDVMTAHFVPVKEKEAATRKLANWKPF